MHLSPREAFFAHLAQTSPSPLGLEIAKAEGHYLYDPEGKAYLDLISGISVSSLGHNHPRIVQRIKDQADRFLHAMVYGETVQAPASQLGERLASVLPPSLSVAFLANSGSEAVEGAMKLAKRCTGRSRFVAQFDAYHGSTQGPLSLMSHEYYSQKYHPLLPGVQFIRQNDEFAVTQLPEEGVAAVFVELVQAERGSKVADSGFIQALRDYCDRTQSLLVFDEIQTGLGRTGTLFCFEQYAVVPDVLLLGKALGGGLPIGAFLARPELMHQLSDQPILGHLSTFGGNALVCAAADEALSIVIEELPHFQVREKSNRFKSQLIHSRIRAVHGLGLLLAVEVESAELCMASIRYLLEKEGVFSDWFLYEPSCLRLAPPLSITYDEIDRVCTSILSALDHV
jgi:acetylornithine/N-succinyldiaminopimelate aminotransferase